MLLRKLTSPAMQHAKEHIRGFPMGGTKGQNEPENTATSTTSSNTKTESKPTPSSENATSSSAEVQQSPYRPK